MPEHVSKYPTMAAALVAAQRHAQAVAKASKNSFHGYKYASAEALIEESRAALGEAGLAVMPVNWVVVPVTDLEGVKSKVQVTYMLVHESGASVTATTETSVLPEKGRPQDKAEATALTYNLGYYLRGLLLLPREEESSVDARDDRQFQPASKSAVKPASQIASQAPNYPPAVVPKPAAAASVEERIATALELIKQATTLGELNTARTKIKSLDVPDDAVIGAYREKHTNLKAGGK
jgi:hypothetical protein